MKSSYSLATDTKKNYQLQVSLRHDDKSLASYFFSYSYLYDWVVTEENELARCTFNRGDSLTLTDKKLYISYNGKTSSFYLKSITALQLSFRRLILPILTGGIIAPLSLLALFLKAMNLFFAFTMFLIGILLLYYGYSGSYQIVFRLKHNVSVSFFVDEPAESLYQFVRYVNRFLRKFRKRSY